MDANTFRFRVNLTTKEFEVCGTEEFVREFVERIDQFVSAKSLTAEMLPVATSNLSSGDSDSPASFGEYMQKFSTGLSDVDRILIAGYFCQLQSEQNIFRTSDANELLKEQGYKVANPAQCVIRNKMNRRVFPDGRGIFKVSQLGIEHINGLMQDQ